MKNQKGITLIALVITIIVLLILAGVTISLTVGKNGALQRARTAVSANDIAAAKEELDIAAADANMAYIQDWGTNQNIDVMDYYGKTAFSDTEDNYYSSNCVRAGLVALSVEEDASKAEDGNRHVYIQYKTKSGVPIYFDMTITSDDGFSLSKGYSEKDTSLSADDQAKLKTLSEKSYTPATKDTSAKDPSAE